MAIKISECVQPATHKQVNQEILQANSREVPGAALD